MILFKVNPYTKYYTNGPYLQLKIKYPKQFIQAFPYHKTNNLYWLQDPKTGITDFLAHGGELTKQDDGSWVSTRDTGFGGAEFDLKVHGFGKVKLIGPWSSGCYAANSILPEPATEVTYEEGRFSHLRGNLTLRIVNKIFEAANSKWRCVLQNKYSSTLWPELVYDGKSKKDWDKQTASTLDEAWRATTYHSANLSLL